MTRTNRVIAVSTICGLLVLGLVGHGQAAERAAAPGEKKTFVISGMVGVPGVALQGLPGNPVTDENGVYSAEVESGWSGTVTPVKEGYTFAPPAKVYIAIERDFPNENYQTILLTFTISGNVGMSGVALQGLPGRVVSDENGSYAVQVPYHWSGTVMPAKEGFTFSPPARVYRELVGDIVDQDYRAEVLTYTVSGDVGLGGVSMAGLPGNPIADAKGYYHAMVPYGWSGTVMPAKEGYTFTPPAKTYQQLVENMTEQNYRAEVLTFTISGNVDVEGVTMTGLPDDPITDAMGNYRAKVSYGWAGVVVPEKAGYVFDPPDRLYESVRESVANEDHAARVITYTISGTVGWPGVVMRGLPNDPVSDAGGRYAVEVPYGWSGTVTPTREGCTFQPRFRQYGSVKADQNNEDYVMVSIQAPGSQRLGGAAADILVIPTRQVDATEFAETREDMGVMLQILREKLSEPRTILGVLYDFGDFFGAGGRQVEALHLQGYGALFVMEVSFPLSPALEAGSADGNEPPQAVDPVWQRARQRLYAPPGGAYGRTGTPAQTDPASFEQFKEDMVKTLKHAANIRHLESDESVILTIVGQNEDPAGAFGGMSARNPYGGGGPYGGGFVGGGAYSSGGGFSSSGGANVYSDSSSYSSGSGRMATSRRGGRRPDAVPTASTVLTIAATKADIDAFAKGDLDFDEFSTRVKTFSY